MKKILLIKMTSMGDLMHALPALTDAANVFPDIQFDWVVDEAFSDIPLWHPSVNRVIKSAHRRWKKQVSQSFSSGELGNFYRQLNMDNYDYVIDSQSNLKSATVALLRRIGKTSGNIHGLDRNGVREKPAHWVYQHQYTARRNEHSILQQRRLMANTLCPIRIQTSVSTVYNSNYLLSTYQRTSFFLFITLAGKLSCGPNNTGAS
jgi:heptosyltransferase-1